MIKRIVLAAAVLATTMVPMAASAQGWRGGDRDRDGRYERYERRADRNRYDGGRYTRRERYNDNRRYARDQYRDSYRYGYRQPYYGGGYYNRRPQYGYGYGGGYYNRPNRWYRGAVLPYDYRRSWYLSDYDRYGYGPPPRGHGYYRTDTGDIVVAALATGVILSLLND